MQPGALDGVFTLLGIGRVPLTIWLAVFLFGFAAIGVSIQSLSDNLLGAPLYRWVAAIVAAADTQPAMLGARPTARRKWFSHARQSKSDAEPNALLARFPQTAEGE